jgi:hypothetical protein
MFGVLQRQAWPPFERRFGALSLAPWDLRVQPVRRGCISFGGGATVGSPPRQTAAVGRRVR